MAFNDYIARELTDTEKRLLEVVQLVYRKHGLGDDYAVGWDELSDKLHDVLCNVMGDDYDAWHRRAVFERDHPVYPRSERGG